MSLEKLASDLANFKYGMSSPDKLNNQIEKGVDFIPNTDAPGFTPKTDLESLYHKVNSEYSAKEFIPASDGTFAPEGGGVAPYANLKPLESRRSAFISIANGAIGLSVDGVHPPSLAEYSSIAEWKASQIYKPFTKTMTTLLDIGGFSIGNQPAGLTKSNPTALNAHGSDFMVTPLANYTSRYSPPSILSETFTLSPPDLQNPDFSSWMAFSAIGDKVTQFASLLPLADRTSIFSTSETIGSVGDYSTPEEYTISPQTTFNLPKENWRYSADATNDAFKDSFSTLGFGSSHFTDTIDLFHKYGSKAPSWGDFTNVPGMGTDNLFLNRSLGLGGSFREAADPVNKTHPILLRPFGSNWKTAHEDLQGFKFVGLEIGNTLGIGGVSLETKASRNIADKYRLDKWFITPQGISFIEKQKSLQKMNPTIETKFYNENSKFGVTGGLDQESLPIYHPQRHAGDILARYEHVLNLTGLRPKLLQFGGSRLAYQADAFSVDIETVEFSKRGGLLGGLANLAIGVFNAVADTARATIAIGLSNPNKYSPWPSAAPISTHLGHVAFGSPGWSTAMVIPDTLIALHKPGGTFNKKTAKREEIGEITKRHSTLTYTQLTKELSYERNLKSPFELNDPNYDARTVQERNNGVFKKVSGGLGLGVAGEDMINRSKGYDINYHIGQTNGKENIKYDESLKTNIRGNIKSDNVDKINAHSYGEDLPDKFKDFIKFKFRDVVNSKYIIFRAILDGISDQITPEYGEERYIGRPDKVYVYQGADRSVSFNFSIYPKTKQELPILMEKLNYLVGLCYPSYTENEMMITPFIELTIGDMFVNASGLLSGLTVTVEEQSTWELDDKYQFPHYIKAQCEFKYIGNNKLSSISTNHYSVQHFVEP